MPAVLTTASTLQCSHGGRFTPGGSQDLLTVDGHPVLVRSDVQQVTITTCPNSPQCTAIESIDSGLATNLSVGTQPVVLATAAGLTNVQAGWLVVSAGQAKLEAT